MDDGMLLLLMPVAGTSRWCSLDHFGGRLEVPPPRARAFATGPPL